VLISPNYRQPGQTSSEEVKRRDLRAELLAAEHEVRERKRKAEGKHIAYSESAGLAITTGDGETDDSNKRRKLLQDAIALDKDDDSSDEEAAPKGDEAVGKSRDGDSE
jgi:protein CWC15